MENSVPFEDSSLPFSTRFIETIKLAFINPKSLFSGMQADNIGAPILYAVLIGTIGGVIAAGWQLMFGSLASMAERVGLEEFFLQTGFIFIFMVLSPLFALVGLFIHAGLYHLMLLLVGDGERGFSITLRSVAYGLTPGLLGIIPFCGSIVGGIWSMVLTILGVMYGHLTDGWRAVLAYFLPMILCCGAIWGMIMLFGLLAGIN